MNQLTLNRQAGTSTCTSCKFLFVRNSTVFWYHSAVGLLRRDGRQSQHNYRHGILQPSAKPRNASGVANVHDNNFLRPSGSSGRLLPTFHENILYYYIPLFVFEFKINSKIIFPGSLSHRSLGLVKIPVSYRFVTFEFKIFYLRT